MTVYNTGTKLSRRTLSELDGLFVGQLESSYREYNNISTLNVTTQNVSSYNSMSKFSRRTIGELSGIYMKIFENSYREYLDFNTLNVSTINTSLYNDIDKYKRRNIEDLDNLFIEIFEQSAKTRSLIGTFKIIKPSKKYSQKLTLSYKYSVKLKQ
jgi:hypothetical protein